MTRVVLRGAREPGDVAIEGAHITEVGRVDVRPDDDVVDCSQAIVLPGLLNTHHHLFQWMTRGRAVGCDLFGWLTTLYPVWGRLEVEDVYAAARLGMSEGAVKVALHRLRRRYRDLLHASIAETVETPDEVEDEIRCLLEALGD